jgi:hypothetical protein
MEREQVSEKDFHSKLMQLVSKDVISPLVTMKAPSLIQLKVRGGLCCLDKPHFSVMQNLVLKWSKLPFIFHLSSYFKLYLCMDKILCSQHGWLCGGCNCGSPGDIMNYMFYYLCHTGRLASQQDKDYISWNTLHHHYWTPGFWYCSVSYLHLDGKH